MAAGYVLHVGRAADGAVLKVGDSVTARCRFRLRKLRTSALTSSESSARVCCQYLQRKHTLPSLTDSSLYEHAALLLTSSTFAHVQCSFDQASASVS